MATGLPVVASRAGGIPEAIVDGATGLLVPPANAVALTNALRRLLDDASLRQRMGSEGLSRAREFHWAKIGKRVEQVYASVGAIG